jgi:hypothetical protein
MPVPEQHDERRQAGLTEAELAAEQGTDLPDREAMSMIRIFPIEDVDNMSMPINQAFAMNINTNQSIASADASQVVVSDQTDTPTNGGGA